MGFANFLQGMYGAMLSETIENNIVKLPDTPEGLEAKEEVRKLFQKYLITPSRDVQNVVNEIREVFGKFSIDLGDNI